MNEERCRYCHGKLELRRVNRLQPYRGGYVIIENLPALVCTQCGERYYTPQVHDFVVELLQSPLPPKRTELVKIFDATQVV